ncbi:hypothetical protein TYRP_003753 [Tyrophagus putrescentiae]|nr:hypothetical protein TYRP_003753 [Tyrophagus putrescentiae]
MIHHVTPSSKYSSNTSNTSQSAGAASHAAQALVVNATGNGPPPPGPGALGAGVQPSPPGAVGTASGPGAAAAATTASETNNLFGRIKKACSVKTKFATSSLKHSLQSHQQQQQQQQQNPVTVAVPPPPPLKPVNSSKGVVNPPSKAMLRPNSAAKSAKGEPKVPIGTPLTIATAAQLSSSAASSGSSSSSSSSSASSGVPPVITGAVTKSPAIGANCSPSKQLLNSLFSSAPLPPSLQVQDRGYHQQQLNNNNGVRLNNSRQQQPLPPSTLPLAPANEMAPTEPQQQQQQLKSCPLGAISPDSLLLLSTNVTLRRKTPKKMVVVGTASFSPPLETTLGSPEVSPPKQLSPSTPAQHRGRVTSTTSPPSSSEPLDGGLVGPKSVRSSSTVKCTCSTPSTPTSASTTSPIKKLYNIIHPSSSTSTSLPLNNTFYNQFPLLSSSSNTQQQPSTSNQLLNNLNEHLIRSSSSKLYNKPFTLLSGGGGVQLQHSKMRRSISKDSIDDKQQ